MWKDTIVEEIREIRQAHAEQYNYDLRAIFDALKSEETQSGRKVVSLPPKLKTVRNLEEKHHAMGWNTPKIP
ncbi:MAG: hypothetical protein GY801_46215 [bacterium]|nr:hypothetical protein [bacterium]